MPVIALTLTLTASGGAGASTGATSSAPPAAHTVPHTALPQGLAPATTLRTAPLAPGRTCSPVSPAARAAASDAVTACVSVAAGSAGDTALRTETAPRKLVATDAAPASEEPGDDDWVDPGTDPEFEPDTDDPEPPPPSCKVTDPGKWSWSRTGGMCLNGAEITYTLYDQSGKTIGTGLIQVNSTLATSYKSLDLTESINAKVVRVTGDVTGLIVKMQVGCGAGCKTVKKEPWYTNTPLTEGKEIKGTVKYSGDAFAAGSTRSSFQTSYSAYVTMPGAAPTDPSASWSSPVGAKIRCDTEQPVLRGCVIPTDDLPVLTYSRSHPKYGIVVPAYEEIMRRRGTDVLHSVNKAKAAVNRAATCAPFTNLYPGKKNADTCDEFPPASTAEGGQDQSLCAELTPKVDNGVWSAPATWPERPATGAETCMRLHVTGRANYSAGGVLGSLRKYQRIVDGDPFRIEFTA
ncbi:hypothetical protein GTY68_20570 [Streptomyces sp. SID4926]|nr:hypothetical protein [Streptomyces sp. SID4926]